MKILTSINEVPDSFFLGLTMGNFDGLHLGHQKFLKNFSKRCSALNLKTILVTFRPHPIQILNPREGFLINSYDERRALLEDLGLDYILEISFDRDLSILAPSDFLDRYLLKNKNISLFYLGHDFAFGADKVGNHDFVEKYFKGTSVEVYIEKSFDLEEGKVSSTIVREELAAGKVDKCSSFLGRAFFMKGRVIRGAGRGKKITPLVGVYITRSFVDHVWHNSVTNIGMNPTFGDINKNQVETHILDFNKDIYGKMIKVEFIKRLRGEIKFDSVSKLVEQISLDSLHSRKYFSNV